MNVFDDFCKNKLVHRINPSRRQLSINSNDLKIFYANVNRLISDKRRESFLVYLNSYNIMFDVIVVVETFYNDKCFKNPVLCRLPFNKER